jgi:pyrimidine oxygenase
MVIADETDAAAMAKWQRYCDGIDQPAVDWMIGQALADRNAPATASARKKALPERPINLNMGTLVGSYASVASMLDEAAEVPGTTGVMLCFDDFVAGMEAFGTRIQPRMRSRRAALAKAGAA